jgi:beta-lactamase regulating signal transducer with metallopeptidase domain
MKNRLCTTPVLAYPHLELSSILTTDASGVAVAPSLSQLQDSLQRPIACASRQLNIAEQTYSAPEVEMLALVWATKYFVATFTVNSSYLELITPLYPTYVCSLIITVDL